MSEIRKANTEKPYFLTFTIVGWIDLFTRQIYCNQIIESLKFCQKNKNLEIFAYVIMPSHIHLVARNQESKLFDIIRDFKSFTAKEIIITVKNDLTESRKKWLLHLFSYHAKFQKQNAEFMVWQKTNHPVELDNNFIIEQKIQYVIENPVKAGYVIRPEEWRYSSASPDNDIIIINP